MSRTFITREMLHARGFRPDGKGGLARLPAEEWQAKHAPTPRSAEGIQIELPHPPASLHTNSRAHWAEKARAAKAYRALAAMEARLVAGTTPPRWKKATVQITWNSRTLRTPDPDGVVGAMKSALDGLQDTGVVLNDKGLWPERPVIRTKQPWDSVVLVVRREAP